MLLRIRYDDVKDAAPEGVKDGKTIRLAMILQVDATTLLPAMEKHKSNPNVVAYEYTDNPDTLKGVEFPDQDKPVLVYGEFQGFDEVLRNSLQYLTATLPEVTPVVNLSSSCHDMRLARKFTAEFPKLRILGGDFLRIEGVNFGWVDVGVLPRKIPEARIPVNISDSTPLIPVFSPEELDKLMFYPLRVREPKAPKVKEPKAPKERAPKVQKERVEKTPKAPKLPPIKQKAHDLFGLSKASSVDNF